jgi:HD-GYP domain-containing protein (c-di-GMP phosphodiesterase class II)
MSNPTRRVYWALHRVLLLRIGLTALLIAGAAAVTVFSIERQQINESAMELAVQRAAEFATAAGNTLAAPDAARNGQVQAQLDRFIQGRLPPSEGGIVAATLYDADGALAAHFVQPDFVQRDAAADFLARQQPGSRGQVLARDETVGTARLYFVQVPIKAADGRALGKLLALYAPSARHLAAFDQRLTRAVVFALAAVLVTATVLYPIILRMMRRVTTLSASLLDANLETIQVLGSAIAKRDADTDAHNYRVTIYSVRLAEAIGLDASTIQSLVKGAFLHDVGKIGIQDHILLKPGRLTPEEFEEMKTHVSHGLDIVGRANWLADATAVVGGHHEKVAGTGYPNGLAGDAIPLTARIFAIADVFDALTSRRPYKEALGYDETMDILEQGRDSHFDGRLLDAFAKVAPSLYAQFVNTGDDGLHEALRQITERYFQQDVGMLLG